MNVEERQEIQDTYANQDWHTSPSDIWSHYNEEKYRYKFKFEQEACFMLGVMMIMKNDGMMTGIWMPMYDYTGKKFWELENGKKDVR